MPDDMSDPESGHRKGVSRRNALLIGGGALAGIGVTAGAFAVGGAVAKHPAPRATTPTAAPPLREYVSTMLTVPAVSVWRKPGAVTSPGLIFATPHTSALFQGLIMSDDGEPVWIEPDGRNVTDLRVQMYQGNPVLSYWSGSEAGGHGMGSGTILDTSYRVVASVRAGQGLQSDLHEFEITPQGSALITSYPTEPADLTPVGGPEDGWIYGCHIQEIDIESGALLFAWKASKHIDVAESYQPRGGSGTRSDPYDPFHLNAASLDNAGRVLVSARHTHTIYAIDRRHGAVQWRLGGKKSDFAIAQNAAFAWQHHARQLADGRISMFDNQHVSGTGVSSALFLDIDEAAKTATLSKRLEHGRHLGTAEGSNQLLDDGHVFVGWGDIPYATEFDADGEAIWEASKLGGSSYRAFRQAWVATPQTPPAVAVRDGRLYVSWNGATEVAQWRVLAGSTTESLNPLTTLPRTGFETSTGIPDRAGAVCVQALDAQGAVIGQETRSVA